MCEGGNLLTYITENKGLSAEVIYDVFSKIVLGMADIHKQKIFHRDLKSDNIMFIDKERKQICIIDFGFAKEIQ